jgi:hypothetical protein
MPSRAGKERSQKGSAQGRHNKIAFLDVQYADEHSTAHTVNCHVFRKLWRLPLKNPKRPSLTVTSGWIAQSDRVLAQSYSRQSAKPCQS